MKCFILCPVVLLSSDVEVKKKPPEKDKIVASSEKHQFGKMTDVKTNEIIVNKKEFCLPSVKELAKQFAVDDSKESKLATNSPSKMECRIKCQNPSTNEYPEKEFEVDYSTVPVSEIIFNLQQAAEAPARVNQNKQDLYSHIKSATQMEIRRKIDGNLIIENNQEDSEKSIKIEAVRFNGKQVHSLTARSISKEFRDGLKNNSYQKVYPKADRSSSGGDSDPEVCSVKASSPTPSIDLKNMKKFWEEIITANSTVQNKNKI